MIGKQKSGVLILLLMLLSLIFSGCASQTYAELEDEAKITGDNTKLEKRDAQAEKALQFFENKHECLKVKNLAWICTRGGVQNGRIKSKDQTIDDMIRQHRREKASGCLCASGHAVREFMKNF